MELISSATDRLLVAGLTQFSCDGDTRQALPAAWSRRDEARPGFIVPCQQSLGPRRAPLAPLAPWRLAKVRNFIEEELCSRLLLSDLARAAGLSRMHFAAQFRKATGLRPHDYVIVRRIERAKLLIAERKLTMVEIALDVGFQSQAHFCTMFKARTGITPTRWRDCLAS